MDNQHTTLWQKFLCCLIVFCFLALSKSQGQLAKKGPFKIVPLTDSVFTFVSYGEFNGKFYPANGIYAVTRRGVVVIDGPWDPADYQPLTDSIWKRHHAKVVLCLATHFHSDRSGALSYYRNRHIPTYTTKMTDSLSVLHHEHRAQFLMRPDTAFEVGGLRFETFYPGPGHSPDNIVVWFPNQKILYGGCLYKSVDDQDLGNLSDADVPAWQSSILRVEHRFRDPEFMIVGHGNWHSLNAGKHTILLVKQALKNKAD